MFTIKVNKNDFDLIKSGIKIYEVQINKDMDIKIGDHILFKKKPELFDGVLTKVVDIKTYSSFLEMATILSIDSLGFSGLTNHGVVEECYKNFSKELEEKYGVIVYEFKVMK